MDLVVTSPPYWRRRDYGHADQLGQESTPEEYIESLIRTLNGWARLLRPHASVFLNLGDTYRDGFLAGIPSRFEVAVRGAGWRVANHVVWAKENGLPQPLPYRLASRHESVFHLTRAKSAADYFFDLYALSEYLGTSANAGDVWDLRRVRNPSNHLAPFPPELARRAILLACPEKVCPECGRPAWRVLEYATDLDPTRPQAVRAMALFRESDLTSEHISAIRAVGISDAGKGKRLQRGAGRNSARVRELAAEAKKVLGGYFREFTFAPKRHAGWDGCGCGHPGVPGVVLDPFMGSGTTLRVARELKRDAIGVDLVVSSEPETEPESGG